MPEIFKRSRQANSESGFEEDDLVGEVVESYVSDDGRHLRYILKMNDGSHKGMAIPTGRLGVMFTDQGIVELRSDENH